MPVSEPDDTGESLADLEPTARQTWWAVAVATAAFVAFVVVAPFAGLPLVQLNAFFPSLDAIVFVTDLVTAVLLYAQFSISRSRSLLALACGYLFTALIVIPHALTFVGAFSPPRPPRGRPPDRIMAVYLLAHRLRRGLAGVRCSEARQPTNSGIIPPKVIAGSIIAVAALVCGNHMAYDRGRGAASRLSFWTRLA